jgi:hypothetical protein
MKALDYFLVFCIIALLATGFFIHDSCEYAVIAVVNGCACLCGGILGARQGDRLYKKNKEK